MAQRARSMACSCVHSLHQSGLLSVPATCSGCFNLCSSECQIECLWNTLLHNYFLIPDLELSKAINFHQSHTVMSWRSYNKRTNIIVEKYRQFFPLFFSVGNKNLSLSNNVLLFYCHSCVWSRLWLDVASNSPLRFPSTWLRSTTVIQAGHVDHRLGLVLV